MNDKQNEHVNVQAQLAGIDPLDVVRAIKSIAYRKAYNQRPDVQIKRKEYNAERSRRIKMAVEYVRKHPEVIA